MKNFEFCDFHVVSIESGIVVLDATDKPFLFFPFAGRDPAFVEFLCTSLMGHIDFLLEMQLPFFLHAGLFYETWIGSD